MRGSPSRICVRTVFASKLKNSFLILFVSIVSVSSVINSANTLFLISSSFAERSPFDLI